MTPQGKEPAPWLHYACFPLATRNDGEWEPGEHKLPEQQLLGDWGAQASTATHGGDCAGWGWLFASRN